MKKRDSFVLYTSQRDAVQALSDQDAGRLFKGIYSYQLGEGDPELDPMPNLVFLMMRPIFDRDAIKWEETARKRAEAGAKGGRAKAGNASGGEQDKAEPSDATSGKQEQAVASNAKQSQAQLSNAKQTQAELGVAKQSQANQAVIGIVTGIGIGFGSDSSNTNSASGDAPCTHDSTQKPAPKPKATLEGRSLELFNEFWEAFDFKQSRKQAEKAWADIPGMTEELAAKICEAARREAALRPQYTARGRTPKYPQGWLNDRRWEDDYDQREAMESQQAKQKQGSLFAQTQAGQPKTWDQVRYENNLQAARAACAQIEAEELGLAQQEEPYEPEPWTAEVCNDE